ncbi:MAG: beta-lactamase family protein, partial [Eudoraea sp.]|nr:beta-lactamase family protein [Eudoraea sp.]
MPSIWDRIVRLVERPKSAAPLQGSAAADKLLSDLVHFNEVPGLSITMLKNGQEYFQKGYGYADMSRFISMDPKKTMCRAASASKPIAALALGKVMQSGHIDPDASFYKYVPDFPRKKYDFTIRQLAGHTAGIRGYRGKEYALNRP